MTFQDTSRQTGRTTGRNRRQQVGTPTELLIDLRNRHPRDTDEELKNRFHSVVPTNLNIVQALSEFWIGLNFKRVLFPAQPASRPPKTPDERREESEALDKKIDNALAGFFTLKVIGGWTKEDCAGAGGKLSVLASKMKPGQCVRELCKTDAALQRALR